MTAAVSPFAAQLHALCAHAQFAKAVAKRAVQQLEDRITERKGGDADGDATDAGGEVFGDLRQQRIGNAESADRDEAGGTEQPEVGGH